MLSYGSRAETRRSTSKPAIAEYLCASRRWSAGAAFTVTWRVALSELAASDTTMLVA